MKNYNVDWSKTIENIGFMLYDRTHKKNLSDAFNLDERQVQRKLSGSTKKGLTISELLMLADYLGCELMDLVVMEEDTYVMPNPNWDKNWRTAKVHDKSAEEVNDSLQISKEIKDSYARDKVKHAKMKKNRTEKEGFSGGFKRGWTPFAGGSGAFFSAVRGLL